MNQPEPRWTVGGLAESAAGLLRDRGFDQARLEADLLLAEVLGVPRLKLYTSFDMPVSPESRGAFRALIKRRLAREPVAYILGRKGFLDAEFRVRPGVLIPRPETEELVEHATRFLLDLDPDPERPWRILDLGVGSGCILLSLLQRFPQALGVGVDLETVAIETASENAEALGVADRSTFLQGDLFGALGSDASPEPFDLVVSNPPYITQDEAAALAVDVREHEPATALFSPRDAAWFHRRILEEGRRLISERGAFFLELGVGGGAGLESLGEGARAVSLCGTIEDLSRRERIFAFSPAPFSEEIGRHFVKR